MRSYGQYCPVARAAEVLAERWTFLIVRNLMFGADTFSYDAMVRPLRTLVGDAVGEALVDTDVLRWTLGDMIDEPQLDEIRREAPRALKRFCDDRGRVAFRVRALAATQG